MGLAYQIILAEDHVRFRREIKKILKEIPGVEVVGEVGEGNELFELLATSQPDMVILDISMPNLRAMKATQEIKSMYPEVKVIIMVMDEESEYLSYALAVGADGIVLKQNSAGDLGTAIRQIRRGERYFPKFLEDRKIGSDTGKFNCFDCHTFLSFC